MIKQGDIVKFKHRLWVVVETPANGKAFISLAKNQTAIWTGYKYLSSMTAALKNLKKVEQK